MVDQVLWARRVEELGVGVNLGPAPALRPDHLCAALGRLREDPAIGRRARELAGRLALEDGAAEAARRIDAIVRGPRSGA